jgi:hypothetical protein
MPNALGLDDDLEPVDALVSLEEAFALKISDDEAATCSTVGDVYDLLHFRFAAQIGEPGSCMTSMAFYRLRKSLRGKHPGVEFRPDTSLTPYAGWNVRAFLNRLRSDTGLHIPGPQGRWLSGVGCVLILLALVCVVIAAIKGPSTLAMAAFGLFLAGAALIRFDPGALPDDCATVGKLAIKASALNYGSLARAGGAVRADGIWDAMAEVLSRHSDLPSAEMRRDTSILHRPRR